MSIKRCTCQNKFQDERYGKGKRVHNPCTYNGKRGYRCTVCLDVKAAGENK